MIVENLGLIFATQVAFFLTVASPGPANIATSLTSLQEGRTAGIAFALGVVSVSLILAVLAALGVSAALTSLVWVGIPLKIAAGLYLVWMAWKSFNSFRAGTSPMEGRSAERRGSLIGYYAGGMAVHAINPKAIFGWMALISLGTPDDAPGWWAWLILACLYPLSVLIMLGYAVVFSSREAVALYERRSRPINLVAAVIFVSLALFLWASAFGQLLK